MYSGQDALKITEHSPMYGDEENIGGVCFIEPGLVQRRLLSFNKHMTISTASTKTDKTATNSEHVINHIWTLETK